MESMRKVLLALTTAWLAAYGLAQAQEAVIDDELTLNAGEDRIATGVYAGNGASFWGTDETPGAWGGTYRRACTRACPRP